MKKFLIFFTILFSIYTGLWFTASYVAEIKIQKKITELQKNGTIHSYSGNFEITGYPFRFALSLDYPSFSFTPKDHIGHYNVLYDGSIDLILGTFSSSLKVKTSGDFHLKGHTNNYPFHIVSSGNTNQYRLQFHDFLLSPSLITAFSDNKEDFSKILLKILKRLRIDLSNVNIINKLNNGLLFRIDKGETDIRISRDSEYNVHYRENASKAMFGNESIILWNNVKTIPLFKDLTKHIPLNIRNYIEIFKLNELGAIDYDANINITTDLSNYTKIDIDSFSLKDNIEKIDISGKILIDKDHKKIDLYTDMQFTEKWYQFMKEYSEYVDFSKVKLHFFGESSKNSILSVVISPIKFFFDGVFLKKPSDTKQKYVPKLHELGNIKSKIKLSHDINEDGGFDLDLDTFKLSTNQYSISASGDLKNKHKKDTYNFKISLKSYPKFVDITINYINRLSKSAGYNFLILNTSFQISENTSKTIKKLVQKLSNNPDISTIDTEIKIKKTQEHKYPEVGKYSPKEFKVIWDKFVLRLIFEPIKNSLKDMANPLKTQKNLKALGKNISPENLLGDLFKRMVN
jgi:hypothetical protein